MSTNPTEKKARQLWVAYHPDEWNHVAYSSERKCALNINDRCEMVTFVEMSALTEAEARVAKLQEIVDEAELLLEKAEKERDAFKAKAYAKCVRCDFVLATNGACAACDLDAALALLRECLETFEGVKVNPKVADKIRAQLGLRKKP
jgi:hypothetical protein